MLESKQKMALVRASSLDLFLSCSGYLHLPEAKPFFANAAPAAEWGTMVHTWKETGQVKHANKRTATSFKKRLETLGVKHEDYYSLEGQHEVSVAYNWEYGYVVPFYGKGEAAEEWKKQFGASWVTGTMDYLMDLGEYLRVNDLKTGKWWTKKPRESAQVSFYGMCGWKLYAKPVIQDILHWPRYPATGKPKILGPEVVTGEEYARFEAKLQRACEESFSPTYNPSEESCRFCPGAGSCLYKWEESPEPTNEGELE